MTLSRIFQSPTLRTARLLLLATAALAIVASAWGTQPPVIVGRIVAVTGNVRYFDDFSGEWRPVGLNQIVAQGEHLNSDSHSRLALRIGSTSVWLDEQADLQMGQVGDDALLLRLRRGSLAMRLRAGDLAAQTRIQTREGWVTPESEGLFRVDQRLQSTRVLALQGRLRFESGQSTQVQRTWMREGEQMEFAGPRAENQTPMPDAFSDWVGAQIYAESNDSADNYRYVSPEVSLSDDLNRHGQWEQWHGRWGWLPGGTWRPPLYLRVYPHVPHPSDRSRDPSFEHREGERERERTRGGARDHWMDHTDRRTDRPATQAEPRDPRTGDIAGSHGGPRTDRPSHTPAPQPGGHTGPMTSATPASPVTPRNPVWVPDQRTPSNPVADDADREKRNRRTKDLER